MLNLHIKCTLIPNTYFPFQVLRSDMLSGEEILCSTQQVIAGLEALRGENRTLLDSLQETLQSQTSSESGSLEQEKTSIILESLERIELGLGEAQVSNTVIFIYLSR